MLLVQLVVSVISMPVTPLCWMYATGHFSTELRSLASTAPALWALCFMTLMPGSREDIPVLITKAFWPETGMLSLVRTTLIAMLGTLVVCGGAGQMSLLLRWARRSPDLAADVDSLGSSSEATTSQRETGYGRLWCLRIFEAVGVELGWRAYLLPRLLVLVSPLIALGIVGTLSIASSLPVTITFIQDHLMRTESHHGSDIFAIFFMHITVGLLMSVCLAWMTVRVHFCIWPAVITRLYWPALISQVNGVRALVGYTDQRQPTLGLGQRSPMEVQCGRSGRCNLALTGGHHGISVNEHCLERRHDRQKRVLTSTQKLKVIQKVP